MYDDDNFDIESVNIILLSFNTEGFPIEELDKGLRNCCNPSYPMRIDDTNPHSR